MIIIIYGYEALTTIIFLQSPCRIPRLAEGSIPSIFPWTECTALDNSKTEDTSAQNDFADAMDCSGDQLQDEPEVYKIDELQNKKEKTGIVCSGNFSDDLSRKLDAGSRESVASITFAELTKSTLLLPPGWAKHNLASNDMWLKVTCQCKSVF